MDDLVLERTQMARHANQIRQKLMKEHSRHGRTPLYEHLVGKWDAAVAIITELEARIAAQRQPVIIEPVKERPIFTWPDGSEMLPTFKIKRKRRRR